MAVQQPTAPLPARTTAGNGIDLDRFAQAGGIVHIGKDVRAAGSARAGNAAPAIGTVLVQQMNAARQAVFAGDGRELSTEEVRRAYASTVAMLARFRAQNFAPHLRTLAVQRAGGDQDDWEPVEETHPWVRLVRRPSTVLGPVAFYKWLSQARDLTRGAHCYVARDARGVPCELVPIFDEWGRVYRRIDGQGRLSHWTFVREDGQREDWEPGECLRIGYQHPLFAARGASLIEASAYEIDHAVAARVYGRDRARDQGVPDVVLESEQELKVEYGNEMARQFARTFKAGQRGSYEATVPWTGAGLKIKPLAVNARDLQFLEVSEANEERLYSMWGVPRALFSDQAYATGQQGALRMFAMMTVQPTVEELADELEFELERVFGVVEPGVLRLHAPNTVPTDQKEQAQVDEIRVRSGVATINEVRRREGDPEVDGGDAPLVLGTLRSLDQVLNPATPDPTAIGVPAGDDDRGLEATGLAAGGFAGSVSERLRAILAAGY